MARSSDKSISRRTFIKRAVLAAGAVTVPGLLLSGRSRAANKLPKSAVHYQDHPKNGKMCGGCLQYIPGAGQSGSCKVVEGKVSAKGFCVAFLPN